MKAYDYDAVALDGAVYCVDCLSKNELQDADPIFADSEWDYYPTCDECGYEHDYVNLIITPEYNDLEEYYEETEEEPLE